MSIKILHFADAHIDIANYGRHDAQFGFPVRVVDFLKSLDTIVDTAINEKVDLVLFAGDAYKDRSPAPTFQREWGRRIMRLSRAGILTLLLVGNHDLSPALGRAHALESFDTLDVPHVRVLDKPVFLTPRDLEGLPLQVIALPWVFRSGLMAQYNLGSDEPSRIFEHLEQRLTELVYKWLDEKVDPSLPVVLTAHCSVQGAQYGGERAVMLGRDIVLSGSLVKDPRLDYVALGHIHKQQDLNSGAQPPVVYPGSIERIDFGEANDQKGFVIAHVARRDTQVVPYVLSGLRPYIDCRVRLQNPDNIAEQLKDALPPAEKLEGAILRLVIEYPRDWEPLIDESALREYTASCLEFHIVKRPQMEARVRLSEDTFLGNLSPMDLLNLYWGSMNVDSRETQALSQLAAEVMRQVHGDYILPFLGKKSV